MEKAKVKHVKTYFRKELVLHNGRILYRNFMVYRVNLAEPFALLQI